MAHAPALAALLAVVASLAPGSAQAAGGFSGSFAPSLWQLNEIQGAGPLPPSPGATATATVNYPAYECTDPINETSCILDLDAAAGEATLVGSDAADHGSNGDVWAIQWQLASNYTGAPYQLSFSWEYSSADTSGDDESYYFTIDSSNNVSKVELSDDPVGTNTGQVSLTLATGSRFGVGVSTLANNGGPGYLTITQFNPSTEVPAPLPLLGAGAAFSWSRQLRRRQQRAAARAMDASKAA